MVTTHFIFNPNRKIGFWMNICNIHYNTSNSSYICYYSNVSSMYHPSLAPSFLLRVFCHRRANSDQQSPLEWHTWQPVYWLLLLLPASQLMSADWVTLVDCINGSKSCERKRGWEREHALWRVKSTFSEAIICCWGSFFWLKDLNEANNQEKSS